MFQQVDVAKRVVSLARTILASVRNVSLEERSAENKRLLYASILVPRRANRTSNRE